MHVELFKFISEILNVAYTLMVVHIAQKLQNEKYMDNNLCIIYVMPTSFQCKQPSNNHSLKAWM